MFFFSDFFLFFLFSRFFRFFPFFSVFFRFFFRFFRFIFRRKPGDTVRKALGGGARGFFWKSQGPGGWGRGGVEGPGGCVRGFWGELFFLGRKFPPSLCVASQDHKRFRQWEVELGLECTLKSPEPMQHLHLVLSKRSTDTHPQPQQMYQILQLCSQFSRTLNWPICTRPFFLLPPLLATPLPPHFSRHLFALFFPSKSALFCRAKGRAQSVERGSLRMDLSTKFGKEIPSRNLRKKRSVKST